MNCTECGLALEGANEMRCAACAREEAMYAAYTRGIAVPPMWEAIEARLRLEQRPRPRRHSLWRAAAAAAIVLATLVIPAMRILMVGRTSADSPSIVAATHYRDAIRQLEPHAGSDAAPLLAPLNAAIKTAERDAGRAPHDPNAITRVVAAYDAKLQLLRASAND